MISKYVKDAFVSPHFVISNKRNNNGQFTKVNLNLKSLNLKKSKAK